MMVFVLPLVLVSGYFTGANTLAIIKYAPELCGMAACAFTVVYAVRNGFAKIRFIYWVLILLIAIHLLFGIIANDVKAGTVIVGGRIYLRTIPFFLLAIALPPNESTLKKQFLVVFGVAILQLPIAAYQKVSNYQQALTEGYISVTGDYVVGTLGGSGFLSLFLICFATTIVALYAKKKLSLGITALSLLVVLTSTIINETKVTFFLAPVAIAIPMLAAAGKNRVKASITTLILVVGFVSIFVPVYNHFFMLPRYGYGFIEFLTMEGRVEGYLARGEDVGTTEPVGRLRAIQIAADVIQEDPTSAVFGMGMGSVTESTFGPQFEGEHYSIYETVKGPTFARLMWEIGYLGTALVLLLLFLVFTDARRMFKQDNAYGVLALAYLAILPIMVVGMAYRDLLLSPALGVCFWYYCGVVAAASQFQTSPSTEEAKGSKPRRLQFSDARAAGGELSLTPMGAVRGKAQPNLARRPES